MKLQTPKGEILVSQITAGEKIKLHWVRRIVSQYSKLVVVVRGGGGGEGVTVIYFGIYIQGNKFLSIDTTLLITNLTTILLINFYIKLTTIFITNYFL